MSESVKKSVARSRIWCLDSPDSTRGLADWDKPTHYVQSAPCPIEPERHQGIGSKRCNDLSIALTESPVHELTWTWGPSELIIRDDALRLLKEQGFTGYEIGPVTARMKVRATKPDPCDDNPGLRADEAERVEIPKLWEVKVRGWGGVAPQESGIHLEKYCPGCGYRRYSHWTNPSRLFDPSQWDGSDFFMIWPLPVYVFVTQRVADFIARMKWKRCRLVPLAELRSAGSGFSPGSLRTHWPDDLARRIGEPLGIYS